MDIRKVNISLTHQSALAAMDAHICDALKIKVDAYHDNLVYTSMLQAGVKQFQFVGEKIRYHNYPFLKDKISYYPFDKYQQTHQTVKALISPKTDNFVLEWFVTELIHCNNTQSSMIATLPIPSPKDLIKCNDLHAYTAIKNILDKIKKNEVILPIPKHSLSANDVDIFSDIFHSLQFDYYSSSHDILTLDEKHTNSIIKELSNNSKKLYEKFNKYLDLKQTVINISPSVSSLLETLYGSIPKFAFDTISIAMQNINKNDKQICIYDYRKVHLGLLTDYYREKTGIMFELEDS